MGYVTVCVSSHKFGEILQSASVGEASKTSINFKCPCCKIVLQLQVNILDAEEAETPAVGYEVIASDYEENIEEDVKFAEEPETPENDEVMEVAVVHRIEEDSEDEITGTQITQQEIDLINDSKPWECVNCGKMYRDKRSLDAHQRDFQPCYEMIAVTDLGSIRARGHCPLCSEHFYTSRGFTEHVRLIHNYNLKASRCEICKKEFTNDHKRRQHVQRDHLDKIGAMFHCRYCSNMYVREKQCREHEKKHPEHQEDEDSCDEY